MKGSFSFEFCSNFVLHERGGETNIVILFMRFSKNEAR